MKNILYLSIALFVLTWVTMEHVSSVRNRIVEEQTQLIEERQARHAKARELKAAAAEAEATN